MTVAPEHAELSDSLNAYIDGALDDVTRRRLERHLTACAVCRLDLEDLRATRAALRALPQLTAPRSFALPLTAPPPTAVHAPVDALPPPRAAAAFPAAARDAPLPGARAPAPWMTWAWRVGSLAAAACVLLAVVTSVISPPPGADVTLSARSSGPAAGMPAGLADRDSSQRTSPALRQAQGESAAAQSAPAAPALAAQSGAPLAPTATPASSASLRQEGQAAQQAGQPGAAAARVVPAPTAPTAAGASRPPSVESVPGAQMSPGVELAARAPAGPPPPNVGPAPFWLGLAFVLAAGSAVLYALERRARPRVPAP